MWGFAGDICMIYSLRMINWHSVILSSLWISGLALLLAGFSYRYWDASQNNWPLRAQLSRPDFLRLFWFSIFLVSIGLAGTSQQLWVMAIWVGFALFSLGTIVGLSRKIAL